MSNVINFSNLKRRELRCLIFEDYNKGSIEVVYDNLDKLKEELEAPIEIYNPSKEQKVEILKTLNSKIDKEGKANVDGFVIIKEFLPMLTNIKLDLTDEEIMNIIDDPSDILIEVQDEMGKIIYSFVNKYKRNLEVIKDLSLEEQQIIFEKDSLLKENKEDLTDEELKVIEKAKKLGKI